MASWQPEAHRAGSSAGGEASSAQALAARAELVGGAGGATGTTCTAACQECRVLAWGLARCRAAGTRM